MPARARALGGAALLVALGACGTEVSAPDGITPEARAYLDDALDVMQTMSLRRSEIDWPTFRAATFSRAGAARTPMATYPAIQDAVRALGDNHSGFFPPGALPGSTDPAPTPTNRPLGRRLGDRLAYVHVPAYAGTNPHARADSTQAVVRALDEQDPAPCGWIVDLRLNAGGNMYPMVAGVGPILGEGVAGQFAPPGTVRTDWYYRAGMAGQIEGGVEVPLVRAISSYRLRREAPPVAVLYGQRTASSGEATAISFRARPDARSFGAPTAGLSTGNRGFRLADGAVLNLTVSIMADRTGTLYGGKLQPDEAVTGPTTPVPGDEDAVVQAAARWLLAHPACAER